MRSRSRQRVEPWHVVGDAGEPAFTNSFVHYLAPSRVTRFRKTPGGLVVVEIAAKTGVGPGSIFDLPEGYRSDNDFNFIGYDDAGTRVQFRLLGGTTIYLLAAVSAAGVHGVLTFSAKGPRA